MRIVITIAVACVALAACNRNPERNATDTVTNGPAANENLPAPSEAASSLSGQDLANTLAASDAFEIASSRLAVDKAPTPAVKAFAHKMIDAHSASTQKLKKVAAGLSPVVKPDAALSVKQQQDLDRLKTLDGATFEQAYVADQVTAHETALGVVQAYSEGGDVPALKTFATDAVAMVSDHLKQARALGTAPASTG